MNQTKKDMKTLKKTIFPFVFAALAALVSCNNDDVEEYIYVPLTNAEKTQQINAMQGTYSGLCYYSPDNYLQAFTDSAKAEWVITAPDSTITIRNFPLKVFANNIINSEVKEALKNDSTQTLKLAVYLYRPWGTSGQLTNSYFNAIPKGSEELKADLPLTFGEEQRNATFVFSNNYNYSYYATGVFDNKSMYFYMILEKIIIENGPTCDANALVVFAGSK